MTFKPMNRGATGDASTQNPGIGKFLLELVILGIGVGQTALKGDQRTGECRPQETKNPSLEFWSVGALGRA